MVKKFENFCGWRKANRRLRQMRAHVRKSVTIDWTLREAAQAQIRVLVRRILRKYGYPPDKLLPSSGLRPPSPIRWAKGMQTVLEQAKKPFIVHTHAGHS